MTLSIEQRERKSVSMTFFTTPSRLAKLNSLVSAAKEIDERASRTSILEALIDQAQPQKMKGKP